MPYRAKKEKVQVEAADEGIVVDMVRQFADPYAFTRELVQNGIDAGASRLEVRARYTERGAAVFSVADDGEGMTREIIEGPLLTLFNSAKDEDDSKIGKYGVGFVSVFALAPDEVTVESWRPGQSWLLRLYPDHSYELEKISPPAVFGKAPGAKRSGTIVSLSKRMDATTFAEQARGVRASLDRWCRHARLPIAWVMQRHGVAAEHRERAIRAFEVPSPAVLKAELEGGRYVIGPAAGSEYLDAEDEAKSFAGFYNRGLTLFETRDAPAPKLRGIRFKVDDAALQHTLSRDNVRHDAAYERVIRTVIDLKNDHLPKHLIGELRSAAAEREKGGVRYASLLAAACRGRPYISWSDIAVPLTNPIADSDLGEAGQLASFPGILWAHSRSKITTALARRHRPVVHAVHADVPGLLGQMLDKPYPRVDQVFLLLEERNAKNPRERDLLEHLTRALLHAGEDLSKIRWATAVGSTPLRMLVGVEDEGKQHLVDADLHPRWRRRIGTLPTLLLVDRHPAVRAALGLAKTQPGAAGELLARYALVEDRGELSRKQNDALLEASGARLEAEL